MENAAESKADTSDNSDEILSKPEQKAYWRSICELPLLIFFFAYSISDTVVSNLILYRTCTVTYGFNETICSLLISSKDSNDTRELEEIVQPHATKVVMVKILVEGIFPSIISLFLGPWSDLHGRKPLIVSAMIGYLSYFAILIGYSLWSTLEPWWIITSIIPFSMLGGFSSLITGTFCYISDITEKSNRSFRMGLLEGVLLVGILIGSMCSSYAFRALGYTWLFTVCAVIITLGIFYSAFFFEESIQQLPPVADRRGFLDPTLVTEMMKTCFKERPNHCRAILWLTMMASSFGIFVLQGDATVSYLFTREKLEWKLTEYSMYSAFSIVTTIVGILTASVLLQKFLHFRDSVISMMAFFSSAARSLIVSYSFKTWHMYLGAGVSSLRAVAGPMNRAILSKLVPHEDVGKVLSLTTSLETIVPLASSPLYSMLYHYTLTSFPGAFNILTACVYFLCFVLMGIVDFLITRHPVTDYSLMANE